MKKRVITHFQNNWKTWILLTLIIVLAGALRFTGIDWDKGAHMHPDERFLAMVTNDIAWPNSTSEYFNTNTSSLNPANKGKTFFVYGTFPVFSRKLVADLTGYGHYTGYTLVGRALSAFFDILSIIVVFFIAKNLFGKKVALLSAFFLAITVIHIQHAHFSVVDTYATFFVLISFYFLLLYLKTHKLAYALLLGTSMGFGLASKINSIFLSPIIGFGLLVVLVDLIEKRVKDRMPTRKAIFLSASQVILTGIIIFLIAGIFFRVLQPYAFNGPDISPMSFSDNFIHSMKEVSRLASKESGTGYVPSFQWVDRPSYFLVENLTLWGIGIPLSIICWLGLIYGIFCLLKKDYRPLFPVIWVVFILIYQSLQFVKPQRYVLPAIPFLVILGAFFTINFTQNMCKEVHHRTRRIIYGVIVFVIFSCLIWPLAFTSIYLGVHPRIAASAWIYENIPENSTVTVEPWDDGIPFHQEFMPPQRNYKSVTLDLFGAENEQKLAEMSKQLSSADYIFITSGRNYKVIPRLSKHENVARYYDLLFSGKLGFTLEKAFANYPSLFGIEINDDDAEEPFVVYDHPKVLIFKNIDRLSNGSILSLLTGEKK
jgi:hypothetical protein